VYSCKTILTKVILRASLVFAACLFLTGCGEKHAPPLPAMVDFNFDVKPILVQKCYLCHGPDSSGRKGGLRLDTFEGATAALKEGGHAIIPGNPGDSKLIFRVNADDPELVMPPPETKLTLTEREIALLTKWIKQGADWQPHWAFIPPKVRPLDLPSAKSEIDFFLESRIEQNEMRVAPQADKNSLIRRVSYVLTGLPPTEEAIDRFLTDDSEGSYEKMVDRYLNSLRFGEKWARHWMDVVRYAETRGHEFDFPIAGAWRYRDYLIRAFNEDLPYDQLVKEQLAGDLLSTPRNNSETDTNESRLGTIFYALWEGKHSPVDVRMDEADRIDNLIDVTSKAFQGLTVSCARCHDHKFDPITAADYYSLYGVMESSRFTMVPADRTLTEERNFDEVNNIEKYIRKMVAGNWKNDQATISIKALPSKENAKVVAGSDTARYQVIGDFRYNGLSGWRSDGLAFGKHTTLGKPVFNAQKKLIQFAAGKASSRSVGPGIFGALRSPDFTISTNFIGVRALGKKSSIRIIIDNFQLISYPIFQGMDQKVDSQAAYDYQFDVSPWNGRKAYIEIIPGTYKNHVYSMESDAFVEVEYAIAFDGKWKAPPFGDSPESFTLHQAVEAWENFNCSPQQVALMNKALGSGRLPQEFPEITDPLMKGQRLATGVYDSVFFYGITEGFGINSPVFIRGSYKELTKPIPRKFLSAIPVKDSVFLSEGSGRLSLATSITAPENPLTSRVMVNRIWHHVFGRGIVETVDNFGLQGKLPTHPELLDFLAIKFQKEGWSTKKMVKYMVMSDAFRRSVTAPDETRKIDPDNLLLSHYPMRRLEAEDVRDAMLAMSGRLDTLMFGPPVPLHITDFMQGRGKPDKSGPLDGNGRRSIYQEVRRNFLEPMMLTFDRPIPFTTFGKRNVTNVPAQSLILMNDTFVILQAETMAKKIIEQPLLSLEERVTWVYKRAFARMPTPQELTEAKAFMYLIAGMHGVREQDILTAPDVWKDYCHSVFNTKEFIYLI